MRRLQVLWARFGDCKGRALFLLTAVVHMDAFPQSRIAQEDRRSQCLVQRVAGRMGRNLTEAQSHPLVDDSLVGSVLGWCQSTKERHTVVAAVVGFAASAVVDQVQVAN